MGLFKLRQSLYIYIYKRLEDSTSWQRPHRSLQVNSQPSMLPLGGQLFFLPVPRYASCVHQDGLFSILTRFEDRWAKRPAPCLRFSGRTSGARLETTLCCLGRRHDNCSLARPLRPKRDMLSAVKGRKLFATKAWSQPDDNVQLRG